MNYQIVPATLYEAQNAYKRLQFQMNMDDPETTILEIKTFLKMYPDVAMPFNDLGVLYSRIGDKLLALACYEKANRIQPANPTIVKNLAEFYFVELGWTDDAIIMLTQLLHSYPEDAELLQLLSEISNRIGRTQEAKLFTQRLEELENRCCADAVYQPSDVTPPTPEPIVPQTPPEIVVEPQPETSDLDQILERLRGTLHQTPTPPAGEASLRQEDLYALAQTQLAAGNDVQAVATLELLTAREPANALAHNDLGVLLTRLGNFEKARESHEKAVSLSPNNSTFQKNLAALYFSCLGGTDEAIAIYTRLLREFPDDVEVLTALAIISDANHLSEQARLFIGRVIELEPWNSEAREFLAGL